MTVSESRDTAGLTTSYERNERVDWAPPVDWTQYLDYDIFGRPGTIPPPDGASHDVEISYTGVRLVERRTKVGSSRTAGGQITETESKTEEEYDRQKRLYRVSEPSGSAGANVTTTYSYDIGNRLAEVSTTAGSVTQVRKYTRDNRGFLLVEQHPEKGPSGNDLVNYHSHDAWGHAQRRTDTPNDLTYMYDRAERLVRIRAAGQDPRDLGPAAGAEVVHPWGQRCQALLAKNF